jgi:hypothetical protein
MTIPPAIRPALAKLIRLMASDNDCEALAAVRALARTLRGAGADLHDFAALVETPPTAPSDHARPNCNDRFDDQFVDDDDDDDESWRSMRDACAAHIERFTIREQQLLQTLQHWRGTPTEKQLNWLRALFTRVRRAA